MTKMTMIKRRLAKVRYWLYHQESCRVEYNIHVGHYFFGGFVFHIGKKTGSLLEHQADITDEFRKLKYHTFLLERGAGKTL